MGRRSPRFDRWLVERYPLIRQDVTAANGPEVTHYLYVNVTDIAVLAGAKSSSPRREDVVLAILAYVDFLVDLLKPRKKVFLALDGVVPLALFHSERCRRFSAAKQRVEHFDTNSITPGTDFMHSLDQHITFFLRRKMSEDPNWQTPIVVFSGSRVAGDAKFKMLECIREQQALPHAGLASHCAYSTAPEMALVALSTHEPHFCIVSPKDGVGGQTAMHTAPQPDDFCIWHIGILRDYLELEYSGLPTSFHVEVDRVMDDFVFLCLLFGNSVLPGVPTLDVLEGGLEQLMAVYKDTLLKTQKQIIDGGEVQSGHLEELLHEMGRLDKKRIENRYTATLLAKAQPDPLMSSRSVPLSDALLKRLIAWPYGQWYTCWKDMYYYDKLKFERGNMEERLDAVHAYVEGLHWLWDYYTKGIRSWTWSYRFDYAPVLTDIAQPGAHRPHPSPPERGYPLANLEYLLSVLPKISAGLLPDDLRSLVTNTNSPVASLYPNQYMVDTDGARCPEEQVIQLDRFDIDCLVEHFREADLAKLDVLGERLVEKNSPGEVVILKHVQGMKDMAFCTSTLPGHFPDVTEPNSLAFLRRLPPSCIDKVRPGSSYAHMSGDRGRLQERSPSLMGTLQFTGSLDDSSDGEHQKFIIRVDTNCAADIERRRPSAKSIFESFKGMTVFVGWPFLQEAHVLAVSHECHSASLSGQQGEISAQQHCDGKSLEKRFLQHSGISTGPCDLLMLVELLRSGHKETYPLQMVLVKQLNGRWQSALEYCNPDGGRTMINMSSEKVQQLQNVDNTAVSQAAGHSSGISGAAPVPEAFDSARSAQVSMGDRETCCAGLEDAGIVETVRADSLDSAFIDARSQLSFDASAAGVGASAVEQFKGVAGPSRTVDGTTDGKENSDSTRQQELAVMKLLEGMSAATMQPSLRGSVYGGQCTDSTSNIVGLDRNLESKGGVGSMASSDVGSNAVDCDHRQQASPCSIRTGNWCFHVDDQEGNTKVSSTEEAVPSQKQVFSTDSGEGAGAGASPHSSDGRKEGSRCHWNAGGDAQCGENDASVDRSKIQDSACLEEMQGTVSDVFGPGDVANPAATAIVGDTAGDLVAKVPVEGTSKAVAVDAAFATPHTQIHGNEIAAEEMHNTRASGSMAEAAACKQQPAGEPVEHDSKACEAAGISSVDRQWHFSAHVQHEHTEGTRCLQEPVSLCDTGTSYDTTLVPAFGEELPSCTTAGNLGSCGLGVPSTIQGTGAVDRDTSGTGVTAERHREDQDPEENLAVARSGSGGPMAMAGALSIEFERLEKNAAIGFDQCAELQPDESASRVATPQGSCQDEAVSRRSEEEIEEIAPLRLVYEMERAICGDRGYKGLNSLITQSSARTAEMPVESRNFREAPESIQGPSGLDCCVIGLVAHQALPGSNAAKSVLSSDIGVRLHDRSNTEPPMAKESGDDTLRSGTTKALKRRVQSGNGAHAIAAPLGIQQQVFCSQLAEEMSVSVQALVRTLGSVWVQEGMGDRANVGMVLSGVDHGMLLSKLEDTELEISEGVAAVLREYQAQHSWVFYMTERDPFAPMFQMQDVFPNTDACDRMRKLQSAAVWTSKNRVQGNVRTKERPRRGGPPPGSATAFNVGDHIACHSALGDIRAYTRGVIVGVYDGQCEVRFGRQRCTQFVPTGLLFRTVPEERPQGRAGRGAPFPPHNVGPMRRPSQRATGMGPQSSMPGAARGSTPAWRPSGEPHGMGDEVPGWENGRGRGRGLPKGSRSASETTQGGEWCNTNPRHRPGWDGPRPAGHPNAPPHRPIFGGPPYGPPPGLPSDHPYFVPQEPGGPGVPPFGDSSGPHRQYRRNFVGRSRR